MQRSIMAKKHYQAMICLHLLVLLSCFLSSSGLNSFREIDQSQEIDDILEDAVRKFKLQYHKILEEERIRRKRDTGLSLLIPPQDNRRERFSIGPAELDFSSPLSDFRVACWTWIQPHPDSPTILLLLITDDGHFVLVNYDDQHFSVLLKLSFHDRAYKAKAFVDGPYIWFSVAFQSSKDGRHYIQMYRYNGAMVHVKQAILLDGKTDFALLYNRGYWYMATATFNKLTLYEWRQTQYDEVAATPVVGISSLAIWRTSGLIYIATSVGIGRGGSPVFQYKRRHGGQLSRMQVLPVHFSSKVVKFKVDGNDYLLYLCRDFVAIYWHSGNVYLEYQVLIDSAGAVDADVLLLPDLEVAIAISFQNEIRVYVEGFTSDYVVAFSRRLEVGLSVGSSFFFARESKDYFLLLAYNFTRWDLTSGALGGKLPQNVWRLNVTVLHGMNAYENPLTSCLESLESKLNTNSDILEFVEANHQRVWVTNKEQHIQAPVIVVGEVNVKNGLQVGHLYLQSPEEIKVVPQITNSMLRNDILEQQLSLKEVGEDMGNLWYKSQDQIVNGNLIFELPLHAISLQVTSLVNDVVINKVPLSVLAEQVLRTQGEQTIMHNLHVTHIETEDLFLSGLVNGIKPEDAVLLNQDEVITSEIHFTNVKVQDITLKADGAVNGLPLPLFVTTNSPQVISGIKTFHNLVVQKNVVVQGQTNQRDLSVFVQNVLRLDNHKPSHFDTVEFSAPISVDGDVYIEGLVNGIVDLNALATRALDVSSNQTITGKKTMSVPVFVNGDVFVDGTTNGVDVSDTVFTKSTDQYIAGTVIFDSLEIMGDLSTGTVNGYDLRTEVMTRENQKGFVVNGHKTFKQPVEVILDVNMRDGSTMNSLDLSDLVKAATRTDNVVVMGAATVHSLVIQEVIASDSINGISFDHLDNHVWRKSADQDILNPVQFLQTVIMEQDLEISRNMNGYDLAEDFVHVNGDEEITGYVTFMDTVYIHGSLELAPGKTINEIDISDYNQYMVPSQQDSVIHSHVVFPSLEVKGNLIIRGTINGVQLDDVLQVNKHQVFTGHVTLQSNRTTVSGNLKLDSLFLERDINGVDFSEFNKHVVYDHELERGVANKDFVGGITAKGLISRGTVNGFNLDDWFLNAVRLSTDGEVPGFKTFSALQFLGGLTVDTLNEVSLSSYLSSIVMDTVDRIRGSKVIQGSVVVNGDLITKGPLNNVNLPLLESEAAYADEDNVFTGLVTIDGNLHVGTLALAESATLDGLLWSHLLFLDQNHALPGTSIFPEGVITADATVRRLISGCDIVGLSKEAIYLERPFPVLNGSVTCRTLTVHGNLDVSGLTAGIHLPSLAETMLRKNSQQNVIAPVRFDSLIADRVQLRMINGLDFPALMSDAVVKSQPQIISGAKRFVHASGVTVNDLFVAGDVETEENINGIDVPSIHETAVFRTGEQRISGTKTFNDVEVRGDVLVDGLINGVSVPSELILLETDEEIHFPITLKSESSVVGNVYIGRHLDGVNFEQFVKNRVTLLHDQEIYAEVEFQDTLVTDNLHVNGSINDVPVSAIALRDSTTTLSGHKTFENNVTIAGNLVVNQLNHVDLMEFEKNLVRINKSQEISHLIEFVSEVEVQNDLVIRESINEVRLDGLEAEFAKYNAEIAEALQKLHEDIVTLDDHVQYSQNKLLASQFWELLHFQPFQTVDSQLTRVFLSPLQNIYELHAKSGPEVAHRLLGWSSSCDFKGCCQGATTHVFEVDGFGHVTPVNTEPGRLFSLFTEAPLFDNNLHGFMLWTNTTPDNEKCTANKKVSLSFTSVRENGIRDTSKVLQPVPSPNVQDAKLFKIAGEPHLLLTYAPNRYSANSTQSSVLRYNQAASSWLLLQVLAESEETQSMDIAVHVDKLYNKHLLIALANNLNLLIYRWTSGKQFDLVTKTPAPSVSAALWIEVKGTLFLLLSQRNTGLLTIYAYLPEPVDGSHLAWFQNIELSGANVLHGFYFSGEAFVAVARQTTQDLTILQMRGREGFTVVQRHPIPGITDVVSYWSTDGNLFLAVASNCGLVILKAVAFGFGSRH